MGTKQRKIYTSCGAEFAMVKNTGLRRFCSVADGDRYSCIEQYTFLCLLREWNPLHVYFK